MSPRSLPDDYYDLRTEPIVRDGYYLPATQCRICLLRFAPYKAGVPMSEAHNYCWGHRD